jgi:hypothetical protein
MHMGPCAASNYNYVFRWYFAVHHTLGSLPYGYKEHDAFAETQSCGGPVPQPAVWVASRKDVDDLENC